MNRRPDIFFGREQQRRLESLMSKWREARDQGQPLSNIEQRELDILVAEELRAATLRATAIEDESEL